MTDQMKYDSDVCIIGGGVAGIVASDHLINCGYKVVLIEAREQIGGRINSFVDKKTGDILDNGQHLLMGAYTEFLNLLKELDTYQFLNLQNNLDLRILSNDKQYLLHSDLTGRLGYFSAILGMKGFDFLNKLHLLKLFVLIRFIDEKKYKDSNCLDFLKKYNQSDFVVKLFWEPIILATLNNIPENAPASLLIVVLKKAFLSNSFNSKMIIPTKGLSELIFPFSEKIEKYGNLLTNTKLSRLFFENQKVTCILTNKEQKIYSKVYISCVQGNELIKHYALENSKLYQSINSFEYSPIISVYLWFDGGEFGFEFAAFIDSNFHWIFNRRKIFKSDNKEYPTFITLVISAANEMMNKTNNQIIEIAVKEIIERFPKMKNHNLQHARIIKEKLATLKITPEIERLRPSNLTEYDNLLIAGDWTNTGLPATIESASISGKTAASIAIDYLKNKAR